MAAETETFVGASGELHDGTGFDIGWAKPGKDPAQLLLDAWDDGIVEGLGCSFEGSGGDTYYLAPTAQGTDAMAYGRLRGLSEAKRTPVCAKLQDAANYASINVVGTGSIGTRVYVEEAGVVDDGDVQFQGEDDLWVKIEAESDGTITGFTGGTAASPDWDSAPLGAGGSAHGSTAFGAETNQGLVCPDNCETTSGSGLAKYYEITFDAIGGGGTTVTGSATLNGTGTVTASAIVNTVGAALLAGAGSLTADAAVAHTGQAALDGQGSLSAQGFLLQRSDAALDGAGSLSVEANVTLGGIAALDGEGTLSATPTLTLRTSAALDGVGTLTADGTIAGAITGQATLAGTGALSVSAFVAHTGAAVLDGQGDLTASPSLTLRSDSALDGTGAISVTPTLTLGGDASLDGEGTLTADPRLVLRTTATLDGIGSLNATPFFGDLRSRESGWNQFVLDSDGINSFTVTSGTPNQVEITS